MSRAENVSRNLKWGIFNKLVDILAPFISRTILIYTLGNLYLGLNGLFTSILQVLNVSELGISSAIVFSMYKPLAEKDDESVCKLMNFYRTCYRTIGFIVLAIGIIILPFLPRLIDGDVPNDINIYILYLMNLTGTFLSYELFAYRTSLLDACQRNDIISKVMSCCRLVQVLFQVIGLVVLKDYYIFVLLIILYNVASNILNAVICKKKYPQYICKGKISSGTFKEIRKKVGGMVFQKMGSTVLNSVDPIVISAFLGLNLLGIYQNYIYIISALFGVMSAIRSSLVATVGNSIALETPEKNYRDFKYINFLYVWIVGWFSICLLCLYQPFINIWAGEQNLLSENLMFLFVLYFFFYKWCDILVVYLEASGEWWAGKGVPMIAACLNLVLNISLIQVIGLAGVLLSTIISIILVYDIGYSKVVFGKCFKGCSNMTAYITKQLLYFGVTLIIGAITYCLCTQLIIENNIITLIIRAVICCFIPNIIYYFVYRKSEEYKAGKEVIMRIVKRKIKKRHDTTASR